MKPVLKQVGYLSLVSCLFIMQSLQAVTIGSDTKVDRFEAQQIIMNGDRVAGFAALESGFKIFSSLSSGQWDSYFPVSGIINFQNGTLVLTRDFLMTDTADIRIIGDIVGNHHVMDIAPSITCIPNQTEEELNCDVILTFTQDQGNPVISVDWAFDERTLLVGTRKPGQNDAIRVLDWNGTSSLALLNSTALSSTNKLNRIQWRPDGSYQFAISRDAEATGGEVIIFQFTPGPNTVTSLSSAELSGANATSLEWSKNADFLIVGRTTAGAEVAVYAVDGAGIISGPVETEDVPGGNRLISKDGLSLNGDGEFLAVGCTNAGTENEIFIYTFDDGTGALSLVSSNTNFGANVNALDFGNHSDLFAVATDGTPKISLFTLDTTTGAITGPLTSQNPSGNTQVVEWNPNAHCLASGHSNGHTRVFSYNSTTTTLTEIDDEQRNGQSIDDLDWSPAGEWLVSAGSDSAVAIYHANTGQGFGCVTFSDLTMRLNCNLCLKDICITFTGENKIKGRGKILTLQPTAQIIVGPNSSLAFEDIIVKGISDTNIRCLDNTATVSFKNCEWVMDSNYNFTVGHFDVIKDLLVVGEGKQFAYRSSVQSTVQEVGRMILDEGVTFSYDPTSADRTLLKLVEETSQLILSGATLHSTTTGLRLTKGELVVDRESFLQSEATVEAEAIAFGDGASAANNLTVRLKPAANLELTQGILVYDEV